VIATVPADIKLGLKVGLLVATLCLQNRDRPATKKFYIYGAGASTGKEQKWIEK
jgi:hypothetical protein